MLKAKFSEAGFPAQVENLSFFEPKIDGLQDGDDEEDDEDGDDDDDDDEEGDEEDGSSEEEDDK